MIKYEKRRITALIIAAAIALAILPAAGAGAAPGIFNVYEAAYSSVFEEARAGIRSQDNNWYIIGSKDYPTDDISEVSYAFYDIDKNGVTELIFVTGGQGAIIYTLVDGKPVRLMEWGGYRDCFDGINARGYMHGSGSSGADSGGEGFYKISEDGKSVVQVAYIDYLVIDENTVEFTVTTPELTMKMSKTELDIFMKTVQAPDIKLDGWKTLTDQSGKAAAGAAPGGTAPGGTGPNGTAPGGTGASGTKPGGSASGGLVAKPTAAAVYVDGIEITFDAYNINDNNYFKLRDIAFVLNWSEKQFSVGWDAANDAITLTSGELYTPAGGELSGKSSSVKTATPTTSRIFLDGREVGFTAYRIDNYNYFKLRDVGEALDFNVSWRNGSIWVDTEQSYSALD